MTHDMTKPSPLALSAGCGLLMAAAGGAGSGGPAMVAAAATAAAVLVGLLLRPVATLAVLLAVTTIVLSDPVPAIAAVSGFAAAAYLVLRHTATVTAPTIIAAAGFTFVGLVATAFPLQVPWLPLLAPLAAFGCYALVIRPFLGDG
ncbi:MAG: hypothetical protein ACRDTN_03250 [Mycobacterium sp.]